MLKRSWKQTRLDAKQFQERFIAWVKAVFEVTRGQVVPIDGKRLKRSHDRGTGKEAIHLVSAWATTALRTSLCCDASH